MARKRKKKKGLRNTGGSMQTESLFISALVSISQGSEVGFPQKNTHSSLFGWTDDACVNISPPVCQHLKLEWAPPVSVENGITNLEQPKDWGDSRCGEGVTEHPVSVDKPGNKFLDVQGCRGWGLCAACSLSGVCLSGLRTGRS